MGQVPDVTGKSMENAFIVSDIRHRIQLFD
jgi:hypothetical protein